MGEQALKQDSNLEGLLIDLPRKGRSLLSHVDNLNYGITQIKGYSGTDPVIGCFRMRSLGTREILHQVLPREHAEKLKQEYGNRFEYFTLNKLVQKREDIEKGKYKVREGLIVGLNPAYSH